MNIDYFLWSRRRQIEVDPISLFNNACFYRWAAAIGSTSTK